MRTTSAFCLVIFATIFIRADAESYSVVRFETPVQIGANGFVGSTPEAEWAGPLFARKAMKSMDFSEWRHFWSDTFFEKTKIDQAKFKSIQQSPSPGDEVVSTIFAEVRLTHDEADYILLFGCAIPRSEFPASEEELGAMISTEFFRFQNGKWINWTVPHDMGFSDPLTKLVDYREVMGFD